MEEFRVSGEQIEFAENVMYNLLIFQAHKELSYSEVSARILAAYRSHPPNSFLKKIFVKIEDKTYIFDEEMCQILVEMGGLFEYFSDKTSLNLPFITGMTMNKCISILKNVGPLKMKKIQGEYLFEISPVDYVNEFNGQGDHMFGVIALLRAFGLDKSDTENIDEWEIHVI